MKTVNSKRDGLLDGIESSAPCTLHIATWRYAEGRMKALLHANGVC